MQTIEQAYRSVRSEIRAAVIAATFAPAHSEDCKRPRVARGVCFDCGSLSPWHCGCADDDPNAWRLGYRAE